MRLSHELPSFTQSRSRAFAPMIRLVPILLLAATESMLSDAAIADIGKWIGPDGGVHYGDRAPPGVNATPVLVRPNVIETGWSTPAALADKQPAQSELPSLPAATSTTEPRRHLEAYIKLCRENRGVNCEREARWMIDGPAPLFIRAHFGKFQSRAGIPRGLRSRLKEKSDHTVRKMRSHRSRKKSTEMFATKSYPEGRRSTTAVDQQPVTRFDGADE